MGALLIHVVQARGCHIAMQGCMRHACYSISPACTANSSLRPGCLNRKHRGAGHGHALLLCGAFLGEQLRFQRRCALFTKAGTKTCAALLATASQGNGQHLASQKMQWQDGHALTEQQDTSVCGIYAGREAFFQHHTKVFPPANRVAELDAPAQASTAKDLSVMDSV